MMAGNSGGGPGPNIGMREFAMRLWSNCCLGLVLFASPAVAEMPKGKTVLDLWDAAYLHGGKTGYFRTTVTEFEVDGRKILHSVMDMNLTLKRNRDTVSLRMQIGTDETSDGKVTAVFVRQFLGKEQQNLVIGHVVGKQLHLRLTGKNGMEWKNPWDDKVLGLYRQQRLFQERKVKPGETFDFLSYEAAVNRVVKVRVHVKDYEEVPMLPGTKTKKRLLRVDMNPEEIRVTKPDGQVDKFQPPPLYLWLDKDGTPARAQTEMPGIGPILMYRTTRDVAMAPGKIATTADIGISHMVRLKKRILQPLDAKSAIYRITLKGDKDPASAFAQDGRQVVKNVNGDTFELHVRASRGPQAVETEGKVADEYKKSNYFINCEDDRVKAHARKAVGTETDPWTKALRIERWVHSHMKVTNDEAMATADHVARTLEGDCTEHAMLAAAMCRAEGVPSRTAVGLIYADVRMGPVMAFHMWTEVWVKGQWIPIDATLGRGYVGATHLKISDQSWHDTRSLTPMLPVARVVGKVAIEVISVNEQ
jgi:transglutaminase-like putative cysteine protease